MRDYIKTSQYKGIMLHTINKNVQYVVNNGHKCNKLPVMVLLVPSQY